MAGVVLDPKKLRELKDQDPALSQNSTFRVSTHDIEVSEFKIIIITSK